MRVIECRQGSEEWDRLRARPTASEFGKFCTPARGDYASQASAYAAKIVAKRLGVYTEPPPSWAMERGIELEPSAKLAYTKQTGREIQDVGFIIPDNTDSFGGSPDALVGDDGILEAKCPLEVTFLSYHAAPPDPPDESGYYPAEWLPGIYKPQVQALLLISGRKWCDFFAFFPGLNPFLLRVEPDEKYQAKQAQCLLLLLEEIERLEAKVYRVEHKLVNVGNTAGGFEGAEVYHGNQ